MSKNLCEICGKYMGVTVCSSCGKIICKHCRSMEICSAEGEEIIVKSFCTNCMAGLLCNPHETNEKIFGLKDVTDMINRKQESSNRFKIRLRMP